MEVLANVHDDIVACRACPRLVRWREEVAATKRASFRADHYWGRAVPGFGDPTAPIVVLGLAPAAHGANRTGRMFTGDRSGDWLFRAMHRAGLANQATSTTSDDGLRLTRAYVTSAVKCAPPANRLSPDEVARCRPFLQRELAAIDAGAEGIRVVVCLGNVGYRAACDEFGVRPRPKFGHGVEVPIEGGPTLVCSYHPSQQNTFTGRLTESMLDDVFRRAVELAGLAGPDGLAGLDGPAHARDPGRNR